MKLTDSDRAAILVARAAGVSVNELAKRHGVTRQTISAVLSTLKNSRHADAKAEFDATVYRSTLRRKSYRAVEAGLDCEDDQYKRGNLGATTLKGLGDFAGDAVTNNNINMFVQMVAGLPQDWQRDYFGIDTSIGSGLPLESGDSDGTPTESGVVRFKGEDYFGLDPSTDEAKERT